jgi:hypothetical protein
MVMKNILPNVSYDAIAEKVTNAAGYAQNFVKETAEDFATKAVSATGFVKSSRSVNLPKDGNPHADFASESATFTNAEGKDWRVKLSLPSDPNFVDNNPLLAPLVETGGLAFPFTPSIVMSHTANYNPIQPVHTNYPFYAYENSQIDQLVITGPFVIQNALEAKYWIAVLHYLRSVTKMYYGQSSNNGNPPPVVRLNGYGDYVFNNVPVTITNFTLDLPGEVDYIATQVGSTTGSNSGKATGQGISWSPVESQITVTVQPTYSRSQVEQFSMDSFVKGDLVLNGKGYI